MSHPLLADLRASDAGRRRRACAAIAEDPSAALLLELLRDALGDPEPAVRRAASEALARIGRRSPEVDGLLLATLRGDDPASRFEAARALAALAPPGPRLVPALVEALGSERGDTAWEAARILTDAGRLHAEVVSIVLGLVRAGPSLAVRRMAVGCLRELAPEHPESVDALLEASADADPGLRRAAFTALPAAARGAGTAAESALARRLAEAAEGDPDPGVRALAGRARELIGEERRA